ncbi:hypothetical protein [Mucilaginibacter sp. PAMB04168]|uniref:hypothetical protein n=1 Tax=Mucilaginibacter sp. PAMB04168 TaxID=3138567 RepID=UPI0031F69C35
MSLKSLSKTRWKIEQDKVTIYPYGVFYIFTAIIAVLFTGLLLIYINYQNTTIAESLPFVLLLLLMVVMFWGYGATQIEFDNSRGKMRKLLMGFIPVANVPFSKLQGINAVSNMAGSYNYRLFKKDAKYGSGIVVSSGYTKNDDANAVAFVEEAVPIIHGYLDLHDSPADYVAEPITSFRFFNQNGNLYTIKSKKGGAIFFGLLFLVIGLSLLTIETNGIVAKIFIVAATLFLALIFFNAAYTTLTFNQATQTIERTGVAKFLNRRYQFSAFAGIQTLRRSINFVYAGTDINMYFDVPGKNGKQVLLTVISLKKSADIERFIQELNVIMTI